MKKLLIVTAVVMLLGAASGCECFNWLCRGAPANPYPVAAPAYSAPCCPPCDPCGAAPAAVMPGPAG